MVITFTECSGFFGDIIANYVAVPRERIESSLCPGAYKLFEGFCYSFKRYSAPLTWQKAERDCVEENAHLVSIQSRREMRFLNRLLNRHGVLHVNDVCDSYHTNSGVFIGLQSTDGVSIYLNIFNWTDGSAYTYAEWYGPVKYGFNEYDIPDFVEAVVMEYLLQPVPDRTLTCSLMMPFYPEKGHPHGKSRWANWAKTPCQRPICCMSSVCKKAANPLDVGLNQPTTNLPHIALVPTTNISALKSKESFTLRHYCPEKWVYISGRCFHLYRLDNFGLLHIALTDKTKYLTYSRSYHWFTEGKYNLTFRSAVERCKSIGGEVAIFDDFSFSSSEFIQYYHRIWAKETQWVNQSAILGSGTERNAKMFSHFESPWFRLPSGACARSSMPGQMPGWFMSQPYNNCMSDTTQGSLFALCETAVLSEKQDCSTHQYRCSDGTCISVRNICDGENDCLRGEDELNCFCGTDSFRCTNASCIPISKVCDHVSDCADGSDEDWCLFPACNEKQNICPHGQCKNTASPCNLSRGLKNPDGSHLGSSPVNSTQLDACANGFQCYTGECVPAKSIDDRYPDCPGFSQEDEPVLAMPNEGETNCGVGIFARPINLTYCPSLDQIRCTPGHTSCFPRHLACIHDKEQVKALNTCRHFEHLQQCQTYECPSMFKCSNTYCIPLRQVCDGEKDCPRGEDEDEARCTNYTCPGHLRCRGERQCLHQSEVCNGVVNCIHSNDDEVFCDINATLPSSCKHKGYFLDCTGQGLSSIPKYSPDIRGLAFARNNLSLSNETFNGHFLLVRLNISFNNLKMIPPGAFSHLNNVIDLDLSYNQITDFVANCFTGLVNLKNLILKGNPLQHIEPGSFEGLSNLKVLNLSFLNIQTLAENTFRGLKTISVLNISFNTLSSVADGAFKGLPRLHELDMTGNKDVLVEPDAFIEFQADLLKADQFGICCLAQRKGKVDVCFPPKDEFSSCSDLLQNQFLQVSIWVMGILACLGNAVVLIYWLRKKEFAASSILVMNLALADLFMGVYLIIIAAADTIHRGIYASHAVKWMSSGMCKFAGFMSMVSSEMSVVILVLITADRLVSIVYAMKMKKIGTKKSLLMAGVSWVLFLILSAAPLVEVGYFKDFYGHNSVCLPFTLSRVEFGGREYAYVIFVFFNFAAFLFMFSAYVAILKYVYESRKHSGREETDRDVQLLKKISLILITDFLCWAPVTVLGILSMAGVPISPEVSSWVAVFILPINSAMNPILYTLANIKICGKLKKKWRNSLSNSYTKHSSSKEHTAETKM
ncbi:G-protein coupled receptor GRL101-like [Lingula anatina]|uniref:G-protein coupled receptor GRL101-like n=1 Tax=Lingula anatina TaxID=7574 RepID=A0A1S3HMR1_LINAN|nr:G-protein coupled receptor GRL101-like [Lingula anatina]|eukprot:XP_013386791.1 G-protein coupled receptor GRL101-like [Lingula anatina]